MTSHYSKNNIKGIKQILGLISIVAIGVGAQALQAQDSPPPIKISGPVTDGFTLSIATPKPTYVAGDSIILHLVLTNVGKTQATYASRADIETFPLEVILPNGELAPLTLYGKKSLKISPLLSTFGSALEPAETVEAEFHLNRLYDLTLAGLYHVKAVTTRASRADGQTLLQVKSNVIDITVK